MTREQTLIAAMFVVMLTGCDPYRQADDSILCDPVTHKAYYVQKGAGATAFVKPVPKYEYMCATGATND